MSLLKHDLELRCSNGHLLVVADRNGLGDWLVKAARDALKGKEVGDVLGFQPKQRRRLRRIPSPSTDPHEAVDTGVGLYYPPAFGDPTWIRAPGTKVVFRCPECGDSRQITLPMNVLKST